MSRRAGIVLFLLGLALISLAIIGAQQLGQPGYQQAVGEENLDTRIFLWRDASGRLDIAAVAAPAQASLFKPATLRDLSPGYTNDVLWLRIRLANSGTAAVQRYLEVEPPRLEDVRLYDRDAAGRWQEIRAGMRVPVAQRPLVSREAVFPIRLAAGEQRDVYLRITSRNSVLLHASLWKPGDFHTAERRVDFFNGLQFGAILLFASYAAALFISVREKAFLYFGVSLLFYGLNDFALLQYGYEYLWPSAPEWNRRSPGVFTAFSVFGSGLLVAELLHARHKFPRWNLVLRGLGLLALLTVPALLWLDYAAWVQLTNYLALAMLLLSISAVVQAFTQGFSKAGLLLLAFALLWFVSMLRVSQIMGLVPYSILIEYSQAWCMVLSGVLMVFTLSENVLRLREEHAQAEQALFTAYTETRLQAEQNLNMRTRELRMAKELAEASSRSKSTFLAYLSHELRTPLHSILGYSGLLRRDAASTLERQRIEAVQRSGRHLLDMIDELLDYARGEAGRLQLEPRPVHLRELLESALEETRDMANAAGAMLEADFAANLPRVVVVDPARLRQVLVNLITNACRHSQGSRIVLEARAQAPVKLGEQRLWLGVRDNGIGIPEAERARIFHPFEQGGQGGDRQGAGLGLAISRQLVQRMANSELICSSPTGGGSLFHFILDVPLAAESMVKERPQAVLARRYAGPRRCVLIVDDMADNRALLADMLTDLGFNAECAVDAPEALRCLEKGRFDLVIADQILPGPSGWELFRQAQAAGHDMPFVLLSAAPPKPPADWDERLRFAAQLMKPAEPEQLASIIGDILGLEWRHGEDAPEPAPSSRPDADTLQQLQQAAREGLVSDIEEWVERTLVEQPHCHDFCLQVRHALRRMDLSAVIRMTEN